MAVAVEFSADNAKLLRGMAQLEKKSEALERKLEKVGKAGRKAGDDTSRSMKRATEQGFGRSAQRQIGTYLTGLLGVSAAIGVITRAFREMNRAAEEAAQKNLAAEGGLAELTQLSGGDPKKLQSLIRRARSFFRAGGAENLDQAARTLFSLESAGIPQSQQQLFGELFGISQTPDVLAKAATTLKTSLGQEETGDIRGIVSKGIAASKFAPARVGPLLEAAARSGSGAKILGVSDEELLAATALLAKASGSAAEGGTQLQALVQALTKQGGFIGLRLQDSISRIESMNLTPPELIKFLGRQEAFKAFTVLRDQPEQFGEILKDVGRAPEIDLVGQLIAARNAQPGLIASLEQRKAAAAKELSRETLGIRRQVEIAEIDRDITMREERGGDRLIITLHELNSTLQLFLRGIGAIGEGTRPVGFDPLAQGEVPEIVSAAREDRLLESADKLERSSGSLERAAQSMERGLGGGPALKRPEVDK